MPHPPPPSTLTASEAADLLRLRRRDTVWRYVREGRLLGRKIGRQWLIDPASVRRLIAVNN